MSAYLHNSPAVLQRHSHALLLLKSNAPDCFALGDQLADKVACLEVPNLDPPVTPAADYPGVVKLQARDAVVMGCKAVDGAEPLK